MLLQLDLRPRRSPLPLERLSVHLRGTALEAPSTPAQALERPPAQAAKAPEPAPVPPVLPRTQLRKLPAAPFAPPDPREASAPDAPPPEPGRSGRVVPYAGAQLAAPQVDAPAPPEGFARHEALDRPPLVRAPILAVAPVVPEYPASAIRERRSGQFLVELLISESGEVVGVQPYGEADPDLAAAAVEALRRARFEPAERGGKPAAARVHFYVWFGFE